MRILIQTLAIGAGGFIGALARWGVVLLVGSRTMFPIATFIINISGSLFLGWFYAYTDRHPVNGTLRLAIATGFVGAYTTFSTYMFESMKLIKDGAELLAAVYVIGSVLVGLLGVRFGMALAGS